MSLVSRCRWSCQSWFTRQQILRQTLEFAGIVQCPGSFHGIYDRPQRIARASVTTPVGAAIRHMCRVAQRIHRRCASTCGSLPRRAMRGSPTILQSPPRSGNRSSEGCSLACSINGGPTVRLTRGLRQRRCLPWSRTQLFSPARRSTRAPAASPTSDSGRYQQHPKRKPIDHIAPDELTCGFLREAVSPLKPQLADPVRRP